MPHLGLRFEWDRMRAGAADRPGADDDAFGVAARPARQHQLTQGRHSVCWRKGGGKG